MISDLEKTPCFPGALSYLTRCFLGPFFPAGPGILEDWWKARATMVWGRLVRNRLALGCVSTGPTWIFVAKDFFFFGWDVFFRWQKKNRLIGRTTNYRPYLAFRWGILRYMQPWFQICFRRLGKLAPFHQRLPPPWSAVLRVFMLLMEEVIKTSP